MIAGDRDRYSFGKLHAGLEQLINIQQRHGIEHGYSNDPAEDCAHGYGVSVSGEHYNHAGTDGDSRRQRRER